MLKKRLPMLIGDTLKDAGRRSSANVAVAAGARGRCGFR